MNNTAEVYLWGTRIGIIHEEPGRAFASFEYDKLFLESNIEVSPIRMPLSGNVYEFPNLAGEPFFGMPGLVADSLPDSFGNAVIEQWLLSQGRTMTDFTAIDRLCYTGKRGMGALEYIPAMTGTKDDISEINVREMVKFASRILSNREKIVFKSEESLGFAQFVQVGTSAGGARAKALIAWNEKTNEVRSGQIQLGEDFDYWLMKFDSVSNNGDYGLHDAPEYTLIEYAYYKMAFDCGIKMNPCRIYKTESGNHFMTKRFDRKNGEKLHMQSLGALAHISYKEPGVCSYELAAEYMRQMGLFPKEIEQLYRRMVFNCLAVNQDDHVKNISFLMGRDGKWSLAPAYDVTFSYNLESKWLRAHQMSVNGKVLGITADDLIIAGQNMGVRKRRCREIVDEIRRTTERFKEYAEEAGIREETAEYVQSVILSRA